MENIGTESSERQIVGRRLGLRQPTLTVESPAFPPNRPIPPRHAGAKGRSPALRWPRPPQGTRELVLLVEDPDAPTAKPFVHWIVAGLPPDTIELAESASAPVQGKNDMGSVGYYGPEPPHGHGVHHYHFQLFALDQPLGLRAPFDRDRLLEAMRGHILTWGELVGTFER
jgi:Raf kinase inhibitor-like YbhB/YbcL family protein